MVSLAVNFRRFVIIAELSRPEVASPGNFFLAICAFSGKTTPYGMVKFSKFCSEGLYGDTDRHCCVQMSWNVSDVKSAKSCVIYRTKKNKISAVSQAVATARIGPEICQGQSPTFSSRFHPNRFTFDGVITERLKAVLLRHRVFSW